MQKAVILSFVPFLVIANFGNINNRGLETSLAYAAGEACEKAFKQADEAAETDLKAKEQSALQAGAPFLEYFETLRENLKERGYLLDLIEQAMIAQEGVLVMGPPGNAKSLLADMTLGNVLGDQDKSSYYRIQMTPETTMSETHGPLDYKKLTEENKYARLYEEGMLMSRNVFIDEIFDARSNASRNILGVLAERAHSQGPRTEKGKVETFIGATNKYLSEVYEKAGDDGPKALIDRFALSSFVPGEFEKAQSAVELIQGAKKKSSTKKLPKLTFQELDQIRELVPEVEIPEHVALFLAVLSDRIRKETETIEESSLKVYREKLRNGEEAEPPYRATKYHSPRSLVKAAGILKAWIVRDWLKQGGKRELHATLEDVKALESFFTLNGPQDEFVKKLLSRATNAHEKAQLETIQRERTIFRDQYKALWDPIHDGFYKQAGQYADVVLHAKTPEAKKKAAEKLADQWSKEVEPHLEKGEELAELDGHGIGARMLHDVLNTSGIELVGEEEWYNLTQNKKAIEGERDAQQKLEEERRAKEAKEKRKKEEETRTGKFIYLEGGLFQMGSPLDNNQHWVKVSPFEIQETRFTQEQWLDITGKNPSKIREDGTFRMRYRPYQESDCPGDFAVKNGVPFCKGYAVTNISYDDIVNELLPKLNEQAQASGYHYDLPTEAQGEFASRSGATTEYPFGDQGEGNSDPDKNLETYAWYDKNNPTRKPMKLKTRKALKNGLHDTMGQGWEWRKDGYAGTYTFPADNSQSNPVVDPQGPQWLQKGSYRILRSGYGKDVSCFRSAYRNYGNPSDPVDVQVFRLVRRVRHENEVQERF